MRSMSASSSTPGDGKRANSPRPAQDLLLDGASGDPIRRALWLDTINQRLRPLLPPALAAHVRLGNINRHRLVFLADAPIWHAKLRLAAPVLLEAAQNMGLKVTELGIKTRSDHPVPPPPKPASRALSKHAKQTLDEVVTTLSAASRDSRGESS